MLCLNLRSKLERYLQLQFTLTIVVKYSALRVPRWCTHNGQNVVCGMLDTCHAQWSPSWLHSERGAKSMGYVDRNKNKL